MATFSVQVVEATVLLVQPEAIALALILVVPVTEIALTY